MFRKEKTQNIKNKNPPIKKIYMSGSLTGIDLTLTIHQTIRIPLGCAVPSTKHVTWFVTQSLPGLSHKQLTCFVTHGAYLVCHTSSLPGLSHKQLTCFVTHGAYLVCHTSSLPGLSHTDGPSLPLGCTQLSYSGGFLSRNELVS